LAEGAGQLTAADAKQLTAARVRHLTETVAKQPTAAGGIRIRQLTAAGGNRSLAA